MRFGDGEARPYRPFRMIGHVLISMLVVAVVWVPLTLLTGGFRMGPAEEVRFSSIEQARGKAFSDHGMAWPGSRTEIHQTSDGFIVERRWLWWTEVRLPLDRNLSTNTERYDLGVGDTIQQILVALGALVPGLLVFLSLRRAEQANP